MLIYLDMCAIQRPLDDQSLARIRLEAEAVRSILAYCRTGNANLASSDALSYEAAKNPDPSRKAYAEAVLAEAGVRQPLIPEVELRADTLVADGLRPLDALHLASAEALAASYLCTCDDRFLRRARALATPPVRAFSPLELVTELNL